VFVLSRLLLLAVIGAAFLAQSCIWSGDRSVAEVDAAESLDLVGADNSSATGTGGVGGDIGGVGGFGGVGGTTGQGGSIDASQPDTGPDLTAPSDTTIPPATCGPVGSVIKTWSFATDVENWEFADGTMIWVGSVGQPDPGALQVDWLGALPVHPHYAQPLGDLRGRTVTARLWVDTGGSVAIKVFVQTGSRYWWADGGIVTPPAGQWTCVTLTIDNPAFSRQLYDPSDVQILGVELQTTTAGRVYIDQVTY
jgi:hypothetical protein